MIKTHKIRLNPSETQKLYFRKACGTRRFVYNWGLSEWKRQYEAGEKPTAVALKKQFNSIKKAQFAWVYEVTKCAVEGAFADLGDAFQRFFKKQNAYPKFKKKGKSRDSFYIANDKFKLRGNTIILPHIGQVNLTEPLRFMGKIMSAAISRTAEWWFVSISVETNDEPPMPAPQQAVGIDLGLNRLATLSDGTVFENQKPLRHLLRKVIRLSKDLSRKQKGSKNREKAKLKLARLHYQIRCKREDFLHKATTEIAANFGFVALEDLNLKGMMQNRKLSLSLGDASLGKFEQFLTSKLLNRNAIVQYVGRFYPSTKTCHACGNVKQEMALSEREYHCEQCGMVCNRDYNASLNILHERLSLFASN
jgi:putative transposase